jgi:hypothetical protein
MLIFLDLLIRLTINRGCCDDYAELPVPKPRNQPRPILYAYRVRRRIALRFKRKINQDTTRTGAYSKLADRVAPAVAGWSCDIESGNVWNHQACKSGSAMFKGVGPAFKMGSNCFRDCLTIFVAWKLFGTGSVLQRPNRD